MMRAIETKPMQRPVVVGEGHRALGLPSSEEKAAYFEALEAKRLEEAAIVKASTAAPVRPPVPSPVERRKTVDECLGYKASAADPVADILWGRPRTAEPAPETQKYAEPPLLHPRQAAIHGDAERAALIERPTRTVDEILFGVRRGTL